MTVLRWLGGFLLVLLLCLAALVFILARFPAEVVNQAADWFDIDLAVGRIDYRVETDRLVFYVQDTVFRTDVPKTDVRLAQLGVDLGFGLWGERYLSINELGITGFDGQVVQTGDVAWWQQYGGASEDPGADQDVALADELADVTDPVVAGVPWRFEVGVINFSDIDLRVRLVEVERDYHLQVHRLASGFRAAGQRPTIKPNQ